MTDRLAVEANGTRLDEPRFPGRQGRILFAYLAAQHGRLSPRRAGRVVMGRKPSGHVGKGAPGADDEAARAARGVRHRRLEHAKERVRLLPAHLPADVWIDVDAAASAVERGEAALAAADLDEARAQASTGAELARRPFLPGEDGRVGRASAARPRDILVRALNVLADAGLRAGAAREAVRYGPRTIALSPFRETSYRASDGGTRRRGQPAPRHFACTSSCRQLLADELGAYPSPETELDLSRALLEAPQTPVRTTPVAEPTVEPGKSDAREPIGGSTAEER